LLIAEILDFRWGVLGKFDVTLNGGRERFNYLSDRSLFTFEVIYLVNIGRFAILHFGFGSGLFLLK